MKKEFIKLETEDIDQTMSYSNDGEVCSYIEEFIFNFSDLVSLVKQNKPSGSKFLEEEQYEEDDGSISDYTTSTNVYVVNPDPEPAYITSFVLYLTKSVYFTDRLYLTEKGYNMLLGIEQTKKAMMKSKNKMEFLNKPH